MYLRGRAFHAGKDEGAQSSDRIHVRTGDQRQGEGVKAASWLVSLKVSVKGECGLNSAWILLSFYRQELNFPDICE
jgi:hypothetical protein